MKYRFLLDDGASEYIFAPFHDPEHSPWLAIQTSGETPVQREALWDSTTLSWTAPNPGGGFLAKLCAPFDAHTHDTLIACLSLPKGCRFRIALMNRKLAVIGHWSKEFHGIGQRQEIAVRLSALGPELWRRLLLGKAAREFAGIALKVTFDQPTSGVLSLSWLGLRHQRLHRQRTAMLNATRPDWEPWLMPEDGWPDWNDVTFERGLVFDAAQLDGVRAKIERPGWKEHFAVLEERAAAYMRRDPEADFGNDLPNHDRRYIRADQTGRTPYHWEALVLAFVGLVRRDKAVIRQALRYLMCMVHTPHWRESAEHRLASSTWSHRCFMEEMTTTSVALMLDWLGFALLPRTKALIRQALWERGITAVQRDLYAHDYLHQMNQGAVFCRAIVLGGLMLEKTWPRLGHQVDAAYTMMNDVLDTYVKPDGGVHEGVGYLCQMMTATLWTTIAYARARGRDWQAEVKQRFGATDRFVAAMSLAEPGKIIPAGDCRVEWMSGDAVPLLAALFPEGTAAGMLHNCLVSGWVHELTGTLAKSGGMIGLVYGPEEVAPSCLTRPAKDLLPHSGKAAVTLGGDGTPSLRLWTSGGMKGWTHSHRDVGQFVLEVNGQVVFLDRGMVQYWFTEAHHLSRSWMHNVLTPLLANGEFACQGTPNGNDPLAFTNNDAGIVVPGNNVWAEHMSRYAREFTFAKDARITVTDHFELRQPGRVAFHVHTPMTVSLEGKRALVHVEGGRVALDFPWAERVECRQTSIDLNQHPIFHICATSAICGGDDLATTISVPSQDQTSGT